MLEDFMSRCSTCTVRRYEDRPPIGLDHRSTVLSTSRLPGREMTGALLLQTYTVRPVTSLIITTITAITKRMWIKPPATWNENPRSHKINKITAAVQSIV